jgi:hypothetical protein
MKEGDAYKNTFYNSNIKPNPKEYVSEQRIVDEQLKEAEMFERAGKDSSSIKSANKTKKADKGLDALAKLKNISKELMSNTETLASI